MNTKKQRLELEYPLNARKPDILWTLMSTDHGLERWIADRVNEANGVMELTWGDLWGEHHTMCARIMEREKNSHIKLKWLDDTDPDAYWEMRIGRSELTEEVCLCVTDFSLPDDIDDETRAAIPGQIRDEANKSLPAYSKITSVELMAEPFEKTPKMSIKRFLYH